ncbi:Transcription elongation factor A protein 1, partial [Fragariocoptes setiger]
SCRAQNFIHVIDKTHLWCVPNNEQRLTIINNNIIINYLPTFKHYLPTSMTKMEDVIDIKKQLEKINSNKDRHDKHLAIDLLKRLEAVPMSFEVLQKTGIGMTVNKTRKSVEDQTISSLCKSMVKRWKETFLVNNSGTATNATSTTTNTSTTNADHHHHHNSNNQTSQSANSNNNNSNNNNTTKSSSAQSVVRAPQPQLGPSTTDQVRLTSRKLLCDSLKKPFNNEHDDEPLLEPEPLADSIEEAIYQEFRKIDMKYKNRVRSRVLNLGDVKNPFLRLSVRRGDIKPEQIAKMTADEMASDELKEQRAQFTKEAINDHQMAHTGGTKTSEIKCPACKKYNCTYNQVQTRSADEPMTTFCFCNECGKRWKFC